MSPELRELLEAKPATRMVEVIDRMQRLMAALPETDGVRAFTGLYLAVTEAIDAEVGSSAFEDAPFVRFLDVVFANHYFAALRSALLASGPVPKAWAPLIEARGKRGVIALQFALAGMNAHVNRDLPLALVKTCEARRVVPREGSPQHRDFRKLDSLLARVEGRVRSQLVTDALREFDIALGELDSVIAMWNVERARQAAWIQAETLWAIRDLPPLRAELETTLDRFVGFAGRGILRPLALR